VLRAIRRADRTSSFPQLTDIWQCRPISQATDAQTAFGGLAREAKWNAGWVGETCTRRDVAGLTAQTLSCAARAHVPKPTRRSACTHVSRAMQAARRRRVLILTRRLGRRTEAGPRRLLRRVRPPINSASYSPFNYQERSRRRSRRRCTRTRTGIPALRQTVQ